ncbi:hypothetical protein OKW46_001749 [Paraburkholderia sp. WSM4179]|nr:hypothetical protein [Paraburkholderia sp. WSM4179]
MLSGWPLDWVSWSLGGGLWLIFLWLISVPPAHERVDESSAALTKTPETRDDISCRNCG